MRRSIVAAGLDPDNLAAKDSVDLTGSETKVKAWKDIWSAGQRVGTVHQIETLATIVDRFEQAYLDARAKP